MTLSDDRFITDELLSAYLDGAVTLQERQAIEAAVAQDEEVAWRLESLRQTVSLLQALPDVPLPRSFVLTLDQVQQTSAAPAAERVSPRAAAEATPGIWARVLTGWREFWNAGNLTLRNAAAVSFALFLTLMVGGTIANVSRLAPVETLATAPMSAPAIEADVVALASPTAAERSAAAPGDEAGETPAGGGIASSEVAGAEATGEEPALAYAEPAAEGDDEGGVVMMTVPEIGTAPVTGPVPAPDAPGLLLPPGGMGMGGGGDGMGGDGMGGDGRGGPDARLLPPEAYMTAPEEAIIVEPSPVAESAALAEEPGAASAAAVVEESPVQAAVSEDEAAPEPAETPAAVALAQPSPPAQPTAAKTATAADALTAEPMVEEAPPFPPLPPATPGLPLLGIAQAGGALLTLVLASLWWRSRTRRPNADR